MFFTKIAFAAALSATLLNGVAAEPRGGFRGFRGNRNGGGSSTSSSSGSSSSSNALVLLASNVATGSQSNGQDSTADPGTAASLTDNANFINFCSGKTLTNGLQQDGGSCNGIVMGDMPASNLMISSIITNPAPGDVIQANQDFTVTMQVNNLEAGTFTNPDNTYYSAPQQLSSSGVVIGHSHVSIQDLGSSISTSTPPDAATFAFFKGIDDAGNGQGALAVDVTGGLPAGNYRVCTMTSSSNHQPVLMPIAQRGPQDDCTKFVVSDTGSSTSSGSGATSSAAATTNNNGGRGRRHHRVRFTERAFIA